MQTVIGIDPGTKGAAAHKFDPFPSMPERCRFAKGDKQTRDWFYKQSVMFNPHTTHVFMEHVHARTGDYIDRLAKFMRRAGMVDGFLCCFNYDNVEQVQSETWQLEFGLGGIDDYDDRKRAAKKVAIELTGDPTITLDESDAILITIYGYRKLTGVLTHGRTDKEARQATGIRWESRQQVQGL